MLVGAAAICWALWSSRNDAVFSQKFPNSYLQVIFRETHWTRYWSQLFKVGNFLFLFEEQLSSSRRKSTRDVCQKGLELQKPFGLLVAARSEVRCLKLDGSDHRPIEAVSELQFRLQSSAFPIQFALTFGVSVCSLQPACCISVGSGSSRVLCRGRTFFNLKKILCDLSSNHY